MKVHKKFIDQFEKEIELLLQDDHLEERKAEQLMQVEPELAKLEKSTKKMVNDMENMAGVGATNVKGVRDKIMGELFEYIKKGNQMISKSSGQRIGYSN